MSGETASAESAGEEKGGTLTSLSAAILRCCCRDTPPPRAPPPGAEPHGKAAEGGTSGSSPGPVVASSRTVPAGLPPSPAALRGSGATPSPGSPYPQARRGRGRPGGVLPRSRLAEAPHGRG